LHVFAFAPHNGKMICTTNAVEALHRRLRKIIKIRVSFPIDDAALKLLYLAIKMPACGGDEALSRPTPSRSILRGFQGFNDPR
jgi:transposase-like protein